MIYIIVISDIIVARIATFVVVKLTMALFCDQHSIGHIFIVIAMPGSTATIIPDSMTAITIIAIIDIDKIVAIVVIVGGIVDRALLYNHCHHRRSSHRNIFTGTITRICNDCILLHMHTQSASRSDNQSEQSGEAISQVFRTTRIPRIPIVITSVVAAVPLNFGFSCRLHHRNCRNVRRNKFHGHRRHRLLHPYLIDSSHHGHQWPRRRPCQQAGATSHAFGIAVARVVLEAITMAQS